jgi:hypothetical protein
MAGGAGAGLGVGVGLGGAVHHAGDSDDPTTR